MANIRRKQIYIATLANNSETVTNHEDKHRLVFKHYQAYIGSYAQRTHLINYEELQWQPRDLHHLELPFLEQEVEAMIQSMPKEKAPGPDGFIGVFFRSCWHIIKKELMRVISQFYSLNQQGLQFLNKALVVLIPKKPNAVRVTDFRSTSLIHSFAKILSKLMANRLAPELKNFIDCNQNAFIKKRSIHNNFMLVNQLIKGLHKKKITAMFIKLDVSKAFNTVNWSYMLDILSYLGFGDCWRGWISMLWATSSSSFLVNGLSGQRICHHRGVRQGDLLSPMLFLLAMELLHLLFQRAQQLGVLNPLQGCCTKFRMSMYADDAAVFINSTPKISERPGTS
jgi:hypothetical protein